MAVQPHLCKWLLREDSMSQLASSLCTGAHRVVRLGQSSLQIYTVVGVPDLFVGGLVPYKFYGRYICFWVQPWQALPVASWQMNLFPTSCPSLLCSMQEHIMEDDGLMRPFYLPSGLFASKNNLALSCCFCLPNGQPLVPLPAP